MNGLALRRSTWLLWLSAPLLLGLSLYRPFTPSAGRAAKLPVAFGTWERRAEHYLSAVDFAQLGTDDACWRTYVGEDGVEIYVTAVFHDSNWKSVHPPQICLEGSNMEIVRDDRDEIPRAGGTVEVGRLFCSALDQRGDYLSLYVYGSEEFSTYSYWTFFFHHLPRAVLRSSNSGFLLRVETWIGDGTEESARQRCADFLSELLPAAQSLVR